MERTIILSTLYYYFYGNKNGKNYLSMEIKINIVEITIKIVETTVVCFPLL